MSLKLASQRLTIYLGGSDRRQLLDWAKDVTHAKSDSAAIFAALKLLKQQRVEAQKKQALALLAKTKGMWAKDKKIKQAFEDVEKGWETWDQEMS